MADEIGSRGKAASHSDPQELKTQFDAMESIPSEGEEPVSEQPWTRICPKCSVQKSMPGDYCPNCGASYSRKRARPSKKILAIIVAAVVVLGASTAITLAVQHSQEVAAQEEADRKAAEAAAKAAAEQKKLQEEAKTRAAAQRAVRALIVDGWKNPCRRTQQSASIRAGWTDRFSVPSARRLAEDPSTTSPR